jgi:YcxB-like protein
MIKTTEYGLEKEELYAFNRLVLIKSYSKYLLLLIALPFAASLISAIFSHDYSSLAWQIVPVLTLIDIGFTTLYPRQMNKINLGLLLLLFVLIFSTPENRNSAMASSFATTIIPFGVLLALGFTLQRKFDRTHLEREEVVGKRFLVLSEEGIQEQMEKSSSTIRWELVTEINQDVRSIYLFIGKHRAHVVPKRIFKSEEEKSQFLEAAQNYFALSRKSKPGVDKSTNS